MMTHPQGEHYSMSLQCSEILVNPLIIIFFQPNDREITSRYK